jgi:hypothetical protein
MNLFTLFTFLNTVQVLRWFEIKATVSYKRNMKIVILTATRCRVTDVLFSDVTVIMD